MTYNEISFYSPVNMIDWDHARELAESIRTNGWNGHPILVASYRLITGSHRLAALHLLEKDPDFDAGDLFERDDIAVDVSDVVDDYCEDQECTIDDIPYDYLRDIFAGSWCQEYAETEVEW